MLEIQWNEFKFSIIEYHQNMVKLLSLVRMPRMGILMNTFMKRERDGGTVTSMVKQGYLNYTNIPNKH